VQFDARPLYYPRLNRRLMSALNKKQTLGLFRPKTLDRLDRDQKWSVKCARRARTSRTRAGLSAKGGLIDRLEQGL
jgi:hypothetical protein